MRILHTVEFYSPSVGGAQEVVKQLSEHLVKLGHDVTVATSKLPNRKDKVINGVKIVEFDVSGNSVVGYSGTDIQKYKHFLTHKKFDLILNYAAQQWATDLFLEIISGIKAKKILCPCGFSGLNHPAFKEYYSQLSSLLNLYDSVVCTSKDYQDYKFCGKYVREKVVTINNGASEVEFLNLNKSTHLREFLKISPNSKLVLNVSSHVYSKGHAELIKIFRKSNIKNSTLLLIANSFYDIECSRKCASSAFKFNINPLRLLDKKKIVIARLSRLNTIRAYMSADLLLFPSTLECAPLVLYESLAAGLPFLSFPSGNAREIVAKSKGGAIMNNATQGVTMIDRLLSSPGLLVSFSTNGRRYWESMARWDKITIKYEKLYNQILGRR